MERQQRNEDRAVLGKGLYQVRDSFGHLIVDDIMWGQLTHDQRMRKLSTFLKTGIDDKNDPIQDPVKTANTGTSPPLKLKVEDSGITTIPMVISRSDV